MLRGGNLEHLGEAMLAELATIALDPYSSRRDTIRASAILLSRSHPVNATPQVAEVDPVTAISVTINVTAPAEITNGHPVDRDHANGGGLRLSLGNGGHENGKDSA